MFNPVFGDTYAGCLFKFLAGYGTFLCYSSLPFQLLTTSQSEGKKDPSANICSGDFVGE